MRRWGWSVLALAAVGLGACERTGTAQESDRKGLPPLVVKDAPLESEGVIGGDDVADFRGTVTGVSRTQFILRDEQGTEEPFKIDDDTTFFHKGKPVERLHLQEGKQVRTRYDEREAEKVAVEVEID